MLNIQGGAITRVFKDHHGSQWFPAGEVHPNLARTHPRPLSILGQSDRLKQEVGLGPEVGGLDSNVEYLPDGGRRDGKGTGRHDPICRGRHWHGWIILSLGLGFLGWGYSYALRGLYLLARDWRHGLWYCLLSCGIAGVGVILEWWAFETLEGWRYRTYENQVSPN
jgi:hypothetical protein